MFSKEPYEDKNVQQPNKHDEDEEEDALSFHELWINSDADAWEDPSRSESQNLSFKSSKQEEADYFEFSSEELRLNTTKSDVFQPENIIFCGKIIPYRQPISDENPKENIIKEKKQKTRTLFRWRWNFTSSHKSRTSIKNDSNVKKELQLPESPKQKYSPRSKRSKLRGFSLRKMSIFTSPAKSRWYLYLFGITRLRSEMELSEIKNRQSRRPNLSFTLFRLESSDDHKREGKGGWGLLGALSCIGDDHQANAVMPASVGRITKV